jgi:hypothetical protein
MEQNWRKGAESILILFFPFFVHLAHLNCGLTQRSKNGKLSCGQNDGPPYVGEPEWQDHVHFTDFLLHKSGILLQGLVHAPPTSR